MENSTLGIDLPSVILYGLNILLWVVIVAVLIKVIKNWGSTKKRLDRVEAKLKQLESK